MKTSELRIGNLLRDKVTKTELKVTGLTEQDVVTHVIDRSMFPLKDGWGIEPIPVTEEVLLKFGFTKIEDFDVYSNVWIISGFIVSLGDYINIHLDWTDDESIRCYEEFYVHQLQNIYFALMGKELKKKNNDSGTTTH